MQEKGGLLRAIARLPFWMYTVSIQVEKKSSAVGSDRTGPFVDK